MLEKHNDLGTIYIKKELLIQVLRYTLREYNNKIWPSNEKGKLMPMSYLYDTIEIYEEDGKQKIRVYLIYDFGLPISKTTEKILNMYYKHLKIVIGEEIDEVSIRVAGVKSKNIAKRYIEMVKSKNEK